MFVRSVVCIFIWAFAQGVSAADRVSVGIGNANDNIEVYRIGLQRDFDRRWLVSRAWGLRGYWEASINRWTDGESINALAISPVFVFAPNRSVGVMPYLEAGIGVALVSDTDIGGRQLSTAFQFEDRIGMGFRFGEQRKHDINFRYLHYSNANIKKPNDGIDIFILSYGYAFR